MLALFILASYFPVYWPDLSKNFEAWELCYTRLLSTFKMDAAGQVEWNTPCDPTKGFKYMYLTDEDFNSISERSAHAAVKATPVTAEGKATNAAVRPKTQLPRSCISVLKFIAEHLPSLCQDLAHCHFQSAECLFDFLRQIWMNL